MRLHVGRRVQCTLACLASPHVFADARRPTADQAGRCIATRR
jgi:hypothetical protein